MKEYMFLIRNRGDEKARLSPEQHLQFVKACEEYIGGLMRQKKLIAAQPLLREGKILYGRKAPQAEKAVDPSGEIQVGYYHILAEDAAEAEAIARQNPEFEWCESASIEVRPLKAKEVQTGYEYPSNRRII